MEASSTWWRHGLVYQVYIRSFADGNGDGIGDIAGLRTRLGYLCDLGVDAVWINPWYESPMLDGGYDVSDYRQIDPLFGNTAEAEAFISEAHDYGIKVIADLVPNHTSAQHAWFQEALAAAPGDAARNRYHFRAGKGPDGSEPPTDWASVFGGPAWTRLPDGDWYLHIFDDSQPDLNWEHLEVRSEFEDILRFWLDRGVDGFRVDVAHGLVKDMTFPDSGGRTELLSSEQAIAHPHWDRDGVHDIIRTWRAILDTYDNRMMVAEAWVHRERLPMYLRPDEYHQSFNFDLVEAKWDAASFREIVATSVEAASAIGAASTWVLSNHDVLRHPTRYALPAKTNVRRWLLDGPHSDLDAEAGNRRGRAAALISLSLPGSAYVYQGEELGLPEVWDLPTDVLQDPVWERSGNTEKGRDGCRVPIPWEPSGPSLGFGEADPWLPQPPSFAELAASVQANDPTSMLTLYRQAIAIRRAHLTADETLNMVDLGSDVLAYRREEVLVVVNMGATPIDMPAGELLLSSDHNTAQGAELLPADVAVWLKA